MENCNRTAIILVWWVLLIAGMQFTGAQTIEQYCDYNCVSEQVFAQIYSIIGRRVVITVLDSVEKIPIENAFLRSAQHRGIYPYVKASSRQILPDSTTELIINVLRKQHPETLGSVSYQVCELEIQWRDSETGKAGIVGPLLAYRKIDPANDDRMNWFERIFVPIVVIGSSVLIVYLFFSVRS
ncbi:MAG: hypothetical protein N3A63_01390 [Bacteroidetes bacterium]|nr:hypothetical protein [Bacteroidota bacterium]